MKFIGLALLFVTYAPVFGQHEAKTNISATRYNTLAKLKDKETLRIDFSTIGCFYSAEYKMIVTRKGEKLEAAIYGGQRNYLKGGYFYYMFDDGYLFLKGKTLTPSDSVQFIRFENELRQFENSPGFCTTQEHYHITSNYFTAEIRDGGCTWYGFDHLAIGWFGKLHSPDFSEHLF